MFVNRRDVQIQWGDCDPANIVYYPRYFEMFDDSTSILFEAAGFSKQDIIKKYGLVGIPMVDTRAKFHIASTHGDWITIESRIESFKRSSFEVTHKVFKGEALAIEAFETRVLVGRHPDDPARLKSCQRKLAACRSRSSCSTTAAIQPTPPPMRGGSSRNRRPTSSWVPLPRRRASPCPRSPTRPAFHISVWRHFRSRLNEQNGR